MWIGGRSSSEGEQRFLRVPSGSTFRPRKSNGAAIKRSDSGQWVRNVRCSVVPTIKAVLCERLPRTNTVIRSSSNPGFAVRPLVDRIADGRGSVRTLSHPSAGFSSAKTVVTGATRFIICLVFLPQNLHPHDVTTIFEDGCKNFIKTFNISHHFGMNGMSGKSD